MKASIKKVATNITTKTGRIVNLITLTDGRVLVRDTKQFDADLKGSHITRNNMLDLYDGTVEGDFKWHKKGQLYTTTEYVNKEGEVVPAREGVYEEDGFRIEGFLTLAISKYADTKNRAVQNTDLMKELLGFTSNPFADFEPNAETSSKTPIKQEVGSGVQVGA